MMQFDSFQTFGKDGADAALASLGALSRGFQSAALEAVDYAKRSFEHGSQTVEKLAGARSMDTAVAIQGEYLRSAYEAFVSQASKMGELATATAKDAYAPMEGLVARTRVA